MSLVRQQLDCCVVGSFHAAAIGCQAGSHVEPAQACFQRSPGSFARVHRCPDTVSQAVLVFIDSLQIAADLAV